MKVLRKSDNVTFVGFCINDNMYHFLVNNDTLTGYQNLKFVDSDNNIVYYCGDNGVVTRKRIPCQLKALNSTFNKPEQLKVATQFKLRSNLSYAD